MRPSEILPVCVRLRRTGSILRSKSAVAILMGVVSLWMLMPLSARAESLVVIVNPVNPVDDLPFDDLVEIFKREKRQWPHDGQEIYLLVHEARSREQGMIREMIYEMDAFALKKLWLAKIYRGEIPSFPKVVSSNNSMREFVKNVPTAIGIIRETYVDADVKILKIDGKLPGEEGYRLTCPPDSPSHSLE